MSNLENQLDQEKFEAALAERMQRMREMTPPIPILINNIGHITLPAAIEGLHPLEVYDFVTALEMVNALPEEPRRRLSHFEHRLIRDYPGTLMYEASSPEGRPVDHSTFDDFAIREALAYLATRPTE